MKVLKDMFKMKAYIGLKSHYLFNNRLYGATQQIGEKFRVGSVVISNEAYNFETPFFHALHYLQGKKLKLLSCQGLCEVVLHRKPKNQNLHLHMTKYA